MARVTHIDSGVYYNLDCGHVLTDFDVEWVLKKGAKVDCQVCTDTEKRVKAARVEVLELVKLTVNAIIKHHHDNPLSFNKTANKEREAIFTLEQICNNYQLKFGSRIIELEAE